MTDDDVAKYAEFLRQGKELRPCPFCGSHRLMARMSIHLLPESSWFVECRECEARGPHCADEETAIEKWGRE